MRRICCNVGSHRHDSGEASQLVDIPGVGAVINVAHRGEEKGGHGAMGEHLKHRAVEAVHGAGGQPQADDTHVGDRRIPDDVFQIGLGLR